MKYTKHSFNFNLFPAEAIISYKSFVLNLNCSSYLDESSFCNRNNVKTKIISGMKNNANK